MKGAGETSGSTKRPLKIMIWITGIVLLAAVVLIMVFVFRRNTHDITIEEAKEIALADAGVSGSDVTYTREELDKDDGVSLYELEFHTDGMKYEYEVNGKTGSIYSKSKETAENQNALPDGASPSQNDGVKENMRPDTPTEEMLSDESVSGDVPQEANPQNANGQISIEDAKNTALSDAGTDISQVVFTKEQLDNEDGIPVYDIEFSTSTLEYEYEIHAETGAIVSKKTEAHETNTGHSGHSNATEHSDYTQHYNGTEHAAGEFIGEEEAKSIAVNHADLSVQDVNFLKVELDSDDGQTVYEVEFYKENQEYDYKIDALTGTIVEYSLD